MKNYLFYVGIDISKSKLDVVFLKKETPNVLHHFIVENNLKGIKEILKYLIKQEIELATVLFCCENTGVYTFPLSSYLSENNLDFWVVPAIEIKRSKGISREKMIKQMLKILPCIVFGISTN